MALAAVTLGAGTQHAPRGARYWLRGALKVISNLSVAAAICLLMFLAVCPRLFHYRTETMLTGSMVPYINPGDVEVVVPEPTSAIKVGQVITYQAPLADHRIVSHRVVQVIHSKNGEVLIRTKGDANPLPDPWTAQIQGSTAWRVVSVVPHLGELIRALHSRLIHLFSVFAIPTFVALALLVRIWRPRTAAAA